MSRIKQLVTLALLLAAVMLTSGCDALSLTDNEPPRTVSVWAAASLDDALREAAAAFESTDDCCTIDVVTAGSSTLARQIMAGAPADLFLSADEANMEQVLRAGFVREAPRTFATNELVIIVPTGNEADIQSIGDLANNGLRVALGEPGVPIGTYASSALDSAGVEVDQATYELDVTGIVTKVVAGEVDAGIAYRSDAHGRSDELEVIEIDEQHMPDITYPGAVLTSAGNGVGAAAFLEFLTSDEGQRILQQHGFGPA